MCCESISMITEKVEDPSLLSELQSEHRDYTDLSGEAELKKYGIRVKVDDRSEKIGYKIREAQLQKTPYMLVVGDKEVENGTVSVRHRGEGDIGSMELSSLCDRLADEVKTKAIK